MEMEIIIKFDAFDDGMNLTYEQAKEIYEQLDKIFGKKEKEKYKPIPPKPSEEVPIWKYCDCDFDYWGGPLATSIYENTFEKYFKNVGI